MKKLLAICFLVATTLAVKAQEMSFEETLKYINDKIACCSEIKTSPVKGTSSGDISWLAGDPHSGFKQINFFDLVPSKVNGRTTIVNSKGIEVFKSSAIYYVYFQISDNSGEYFNEFKGQADAERVCIKLYCI